MGRPKSKYPDLPRNITGRTLIGGGVLYYCTINGRKLPLGDDKEYAVAFGRNLAKPERSAIECQALEDGQVPISRILSKAIPALRMSGIYFLIEAGEIVYVGKTNDVMKRVQDHKMNKKEFDSFSWLACEPDKAASLEDYYIRLLRPKYNLTTDWNRKTLEPRLEPLLFQNIVSS